MSQWYFPTRQALPLDRHSKYFLMADAYERAKTIGFRCAYDAAAAVPAPPPAAHVGVAPPPGAGGTDVGGATLVDGAARGGGHLGLLFLSLFAIGVLAAGATALLRRRYQQWTASAAAHLDSAFDDTFDRDVDYDPNEPSPWALNDAAAEAVKRMNVELERVESTRSVM